MGKNKTLKAVRHSRWMMILLFTVAMLSGWGQINLVENTIYLSGQLTNYVNGAPVPDHQIYIRSDSASNNGYSYYATTKTDANGFYYDTIVTSQVDGSLNIYLYDFANELHEEVYYYRFFWEDEFVMIADFEIYDPSTANSFQANFSAQPDSGEENPLKVTFHDESVGLVIKSWKWDFGDSTTSDIQDPTHVFPEAGIYLVTLTVSSCPSQNETNQTSTIVKQVSVGLADFYHMGGHVFADYFPIDYGLAYLYQVDEEHDGALIPVDTTMIDTLGYYYFYQLLEGKYITKARLHSSSALYGQFIPTYYGDVFVWNDANQINLNKDNWECDITLIQSSQASPGEGQIIGQINYDTLRSASSIVPAGDVEIVLLNETGNCLTCGMSDLEGFFQFGNLAYGTYQLFPDVAGIPTQPMFVNISEANPVVSDFTLVIYPEQIVFSIRERESEYLENAAFVYPNPVASQARIQLEMKKPGRINVSVIDITGRAVYQDEKYLETGVQNIILSADDLPGGIYQVVLTPEDQVSATNKFLKVR